MTPSQLTDTPAVIVVVDDTTIEAAATDAVSLAGLRLVAITSWDQAIDRVGQHVGPVTVLAETAGLPNGLAIKVLSQLVEGFDDQRIIVAFEKNDLDDISAVRIGTGATLLCEATQADRIAALLTARAPGEASVRDSREEATRLARINAEVARFTETLARLTGAPQGPGMASDRAAVIGDCQVNFGHEPVELAITAAELRGTIRARRLRDEMFGTPGLFEDPAWDMLLDLFAADLEQREVSVSSLCIAASVAPTTALRWINKLIAVGLFERRPDAFDRRRAYIALTARAVAALNDYVVAVRRAGLSIA